MKNKQNKKKKEKITFKNVTRWLWRLFSSVRFAVVLILIITGLSLLGALLVQAPSEIAENPQLYSNWVETVAANKVGNWAPFLSALSLFNVFSSIWFIIASALLVLNIIICTLNRWKSIRSSIRGGKVKQEEDFYFSGKTNAEIKDIQMSAAEIAKLSEKVLKERGYRTRTESDENNKYIAADKNRYYRIGTYFSHFSLILFVAAFIAGNYFGFSDLNFSVPEGSIREVGHETGLSLQLNSFVDEYYDNGAPKDYRSDVILYDNGKPVKQGIIQVNHPMLYKGTRFYQSFFGPAVRLQVRDENGQDVFNENVALGSSFDIEGIRRFEGFFELPDKGLSIRLISSATNTFDTIIPAGNIAVDVGQGGKQVDFRLVELGTPRIVGGLEFTFLEESQYSGFQVSRDPASIFIWIASAFFLIGICAVMYFPYRQVWILSQPQKNNKNRLLITMSSPRGFRSTAELNIIVDQIKEALLTNQVMEGKEHKDV